MAMLLKAMKTEAKRTYLSGFALTEAELRRLHEVLAQQMSRTPVGEGFRTEYQLKYKNGSVASPESIDDVLSQENFGSGSIIRLGMELSDAEEKPSNLIGVQFTNTDEADDPPYYPISYFVRGQDRDWVFVTSSQIDERIGKIKRFSWSRIRARPRGSFPNSFLIAVIVGLMLGLGMMLGAQHTRDLRMETELNAIEQNLKVSSPSDIANLILRIARLNARETSVPNAVNEWFLVVGIGLPILLILAGFCLQYFRPRFNFLWGDYVAIYERRQSRGKFIVVGVILAVLIGVLANFISKRIGL